MRIVYTDKHRLHATDKIERAGQPFSSEEAPARADIILRAVQAARLGSIDAPDDHGLQPIRAIHESGFLDFLRDAYAESRTPVFADYCAPRHARRKPIGLAGFKGYYAFGGDSPIAEGTWEAAYWSAQCALTAADRVRATGETTYALCRPPGHHAAVDLYGGFCYLNNAAIAARSLGEKVAILDIDYHHGNGTQEIFYADPTVLYGSIHADPDAEYPYYWGAADEHGEGSGRGFNRNWPLPIGTDDENYLRTLDEALMAIGDYGPRYLVVSAGFDIVSGDPLGGFNITLDGLREIGRRIAALTQRVPTLIVQEGGYLLEQLGENAVAFLSAFA
ncbi:MAG TPA: histone deacetylase family protein [Anaerolineae bacterium]|nr:histone deacetylase family protein [Anaerolineae bacterium]